MAKSAHGFQILSSKVEYKNPFFKVINYKLKRPNGVVKPFWSISRFTDFSVVIPLFPDKETMLVGQYRVTVRSYSWEFPMGQVRGKNPLQTAKQELLEETGITGKDWKKIGHSFLGPGHHEQEVDFYVVEDLILGESQPEENEFITTKRIKVSEVGEMIKKSKIKDGPTIVAYHYLEQYLNSL